MFECPICDQVCKSQGGLTYHLKNRHGVFRNKEACICNEKFSTLQEFEEHQRNCIFYLALKDLKCPVCKKEFKRWRQYKAHLLKSCAREEEKEQFKCEICGKELYTTQRGFNSHRGSHLKQKKRSVCLLCDELLYDETFLIPHLQVCPKVEENELSKDTTKLETPKKTTICYCGKQLTYADSIKHKLNCELWKRYTSEIIKVQGQISCHYCKEKLMNLSEYIEHLKKNRNCFYNDCSAHVHGREFIKLYLKSMTINKNFVRCMICFKEGIDFRKDQITHHINRYHRVRTKEYQQEFSEASISSQDYLDHYREEHLKVHYPDSPCSIKRKKVNMERFGGPAPACDPRIRDKILKTCEERFEGGHQSRDPKVRKKTQEFWLEKYGVEHPWMRPDIWIKCLETYIKRSKEDPDRYKQRLPSGVEVYFDSITADNIAYVGDHRFWVRFKKGNPLGKKAKNPDFIVRSYKQSKKVIEIYGNYFHRDEDPELLIECYRQIGIECIVLWELDVYNKTDEIMEKVKKFCGKFWKKGPL